MKHSSDVELYITVKISELEIKGQQVMMLQFIDISAEILFDKQQIENKFLTLINALLSHELRNPLNSIIAQSMEQKALLKKLKQILRREFQSIVSTKTKGII